jgi:hypothetical protein
MYSHVDKQVEVTTMITLNISYLYHPERGYLPHVEITTGQEVNIFSGETPCSPCFIQHGNREDITLVSGEQSFRVEQMREVPFLRVHEHTLDVTLRLNGLLFETIAQERNYQYID